MSYLYLDTTDHLVVGLLTNNFDWIDFNEIFDKKSSRLIHPLIDDTLKKAHVKPLELRGIIQVAGPGSYTGMRVSEGISRVFALHGVVRHAFYHFEVPSLLDIRKGMFVSKAFKGEFFSYCWHWDDSIKELMIESDLKKRIELATSKEIPIYTHYQNNEINVGASFIYSELTSKIIKDRASDLFNRVIHRHNDPVVFYYRELEQEFRPSIT